MPKISVIVPTLNEAEHIANLIESVYKQRYRPLEVILVDGGSTDETLPIIQHITKTLNNDSFSITVFNERDFGKLRGSANARNIGVDMSKGQYIIFLDADMFFIDPGSVDKIKLKLEEEIFTRVKTKIIRDTELERQIAFDYSKFHHCAYRKEVFERMHFNPNLCYGEDQDFWYRSKIDTNAVCEVTIGRHLPHTTKELKSQQIWYGKTYLAFMKNALINKQLVFFPNLERLAEYIFFLTSPIIIATILFFNAKIAFVILLFTLFVYVERLFRSPERSLKRMRYIIWSSFFIPYYFMYGMISSLYSRRDDTK